MHLSLVGRHFVGYNELVKFDLSATQAPSKYFTRCIGAKVSEGFLVEGSASCLQANFVFIVTHYRH